MLTQLCPTLYDPMVCSPQTSLSVGFSRQKSWSRLPFSPPGDLPDPGIEPRSPILQADSLLSESPGKPTRFQRDRHKREGGKNDQKPAPALKPFRLGLSPWEGSHVVERCSLNSGHLHTASGMLPRRRGTHSAWELEMSVGLISRT